MLRLVGSLDPDRYQPRLYVWAATDAHSQDKMQKFEASFGTAPLRAPAFFATKASKLLRVMPQPPSAQVEWGRRVRP
jgi:hypothetical protein